MPQIFEAAVAEGRGAAFHSGGLILEGLFLRGEEEDQFCNCKLQFATCRFWAVAEEDDSGFEYFLEVERKMKRCVRRLSQSGGKMGVVR